MRWLMVLLAVGCVEDATPPPFVGDTVDAAPCDESDAGATSIATPGLGAQVERNGQGDVIVTWTVDHRNAFALSHDEGQTFSARGGLPETNAAWASVATDGTDFYLAALNDVGVFVHRVNASTGSVSLAAHVSRTSAQPAAFSSPSIAVHNDGTIAVAYADLYRGFFVARSTDQGATFAIAQIDPSTFGFSRFCVDRAAGPDAPWYLVRNSRAVVLLRSTDKGATWPDVVFSDSGGIALQGPGCVVRGNDIWIEVPAGNQAAQQIAIVHSSDGGANFGNPSIAAKNELFLDPSFGISDAGTLELLYYAGEADDRARLVLARSSDGITFHCTVLADAGPFPPSRFVFGDLVGLAVGGGELHAAFFDDITGYTRLNYLRLDEP